MRIALTAFILLFISFGCSKNKPKTGDYIASFSGHYTKNGVQIPLYRDHFMKIVSVNKQEIKCSNSILDEVNFTLKKEGELVSGMMLVTNSGNDPTSGPSYSSKDIYINGTWKKSKGKYLISGYYQHVYYDVDGQNQEMKQYVVSGDFEIKPKE